MNQIIKKAFIASFFLWTNQFYTLSATYLPNQSSTDAQHVDFTVDLTFFQRKLLVAGYCKTDQVPKDIWVVISYFVGNHTLQYRKKDLPSDLSYQNLIGFDFTGCKFIGTNVTGSNLADIILKDTTCDYEKAFQDNLSKNRCKGGILIRKQLLQDLRSITTVYSCLKDYADQAKLLHIACGFSRLPFYEGTELLIKLQYWSCSLLQLKNRLGAPLGNKLVCSLEKKLKLDAEYKCLRSRYLNSDLNLNEKNRGEHLIIAKDFTELYDNLGAYYSPGKDYGSGAWYRSQIISNIKGLQSAYPKITSEKLQEEACNIGSALFKIYQFGRMDFLLHYLSCQNRLIRLKELTGLSDIYYIQQKTHLSVYDYVWSRKKN